MKITVVTPNDEQFADNDFRYSYEIRIDGTRMFSVWDGEPEDNTIGRNFNDVVSIPELLRRAWEAGKAGESFEVENIDQDA